MKNSNHEHSGVRLTDSNKKRPRYLGIGGPVGSGKTAFVLQVCKAFRERYEIAVVTNDLYTKEDAEFLVRKGALEPERIMGIETGGCPHAAVREDISINVDAIHKLQDKYTKLDLVLIESGGDNLAATFSPELVDGFVYIIDVAEGEKIPRKKGPGVITCDLLLINKMDLAPYVGASLDVMKRDSIKVRDGRPFLFTNLRSGENMDSVIKWIENWMKATPTKHLWGKVHRHGSHTHSHG